MSIISNIAEGFERGGNREFARYLSMAKGSAGEVRAQLYIALDQGYVSNQEFDQLKGQAEETSKLLHGFITYLRQQT